MNQVSTVGLDLAKYIFQLHGADSAGAVVFRKKLRRGQLLAFLATLPPCTVAMEACASAHYWGREIAKLGHTVRLIAPAYVKPFVKRQKNDMADAEAICEAAQRPTMRFVALKSANQQAAAVVFRTRDLLVRQRTQAINALRGHLTEFGVIAAKGPVHTSKLIAALEDPASDLPQAARAILAVLVEELRSLDERVAVLDREIARHAKENAVARRLMTIPGIGAVTAAALTALAPPAETFRRGRDFAAWLGLTPVQRSSGGQERLGRTSKIGERSLRRLLIIGASAVARWAARKGVPAGSWLGRMLARKPPLLVRVALANKMARIVWARLVKGGGYRAPVVGGGRAPARPRGCRGVGRSEEGYGATVERRGRDNQCATPYHEYAALIWTRSANSHPGPRHETRRIRGRTHVSTRRRAAPRTTILLAPKGASTHAAPIAGAGYTAWNLDERLGGPVSCGETDGVFACRLRIRHGARPCPPAPATPTTLRPRSARSVPARTCRATACACS